MLYNKHKTNPILVIGGGISGITAAVEAAEVGFDVILVEKLPYLGGRVVKMNQYFPKLCPPTCGLEINFRRIKQNPRIKVLTNVTVKEIKGIKGDFIVSLETDHNYVNYNCTACGKCIDICPEYRFDEFNYGLGTTKAIYLPHEMAFPYKFTIDKDVCLGESCKKCQDVCEYQAIDFSVKPSTTQIHVGSIIITTGWKPYEARQITELGYGAFADVTTNVLFERLAAPNGPNNGILKRPSNGEPPEKITFAQCAGSRDENHLPYCSGVCCSATLKHALFIREQNPDCEVTIFYIDLRVSGRNEDLLSKVKQDQGIKLIKGKVGKVKENPETHKIIVEAEDIFSGIKVEKEVDLLILATGIVPENISINLVDKDEYGFIDSNSIAEGIHVAGCARKPFDVASAVKDATGAALKAIQTVNNNQ